MRMAPHPSNEKMRLRLVFLAALSPTCLGNVGFRDRFNVSFSHTGTWAERLARYKTTGAPNVGGWVERLVFHAVDAVQRVHDQLRLNGSMVEIGVHHGKFFLALDQIRADDERAFALDLFSAQQELNLDRSGLGDEIAFEAHLRTYSRSPASTRLVVGDSTVLTHDPDLRRAMRPCRLLSLDGGHMRHQALSDLRLAETVLVHGGVVFVDDVMKAKWPGVTEAIYAYLREASSLAPFAYVGGKLLLTTYSMVHKVRKLYQKYFVTPRGFQSFASTPWSGEFPVWTTVPQGAR